MKVVLKRVYIMDRSESKEYQNYQNLNRVRWTNSLLFPHQNLQKNVQELPPLQMVLLKKCKDLIIFWGWTWVRCVICRAIYVSVLHMIHRHLRRSSFICSLKFLILSATYQDSMLIELFLLQFLARKSSNVPEKLRMLMLKRFCPLLETDDETVSANVNSNPASEEFSNFTGAVLPTLSLFETNYKVCLLNLLFFLLLPVFW